jgi:hypothetical protein
LQLNRPPGLKETKKNNKKPKKQAFRSKMRNQTHQQMHNHAVELQIQSAISIHNRITQPCMGCTSTQEDKTGKKTKQTN